MERVADDVLDGGAPIHGESSLAPTVQSPVPTYELRLPLKPLAVVLGFTLGLLFLCNLQPREVPLLVSALAYGLPILGAAMLTRAVARGVDYPKSEERRLALFLLTCYLLSIGAFILAMARSNYARAGSLDWGVGNPYLFIWFPFIILLPSLAAALFIMTRVSPRKRPVPYAAVLISVALFVVVLMPLPVSLRGDQVPEGMLPSPPEPDDDVLIVTPLWEYYLVTTDIGFIGIVIQMGAGINALGLGGLWSLLRPEEFRRALAMSAPVGPMEGPAPPQTAPQLKLYG